MQICGPSPRFLSSSSRINVKLRHKISFDPLRLLGNICRSPAAENVMRQRLEQADLSQIFCDSAGTLDAHAGHSPDSRMTAAGQRRGLPMNGKARGVRPEDFEKFDLILAMDRANFSDLQRIAPNPQAMEKVRLFANTAAITMIQKCPIPIMADRRDSNMYSISWRMAAKGFWKIFSSRRSSDF